MAAVTPDEHERQQDGHCRARVNLRPAAARPFGAAARAALKDTLFPDDPFRGLGGMPPARRAWRVARYFVPALDWGAGYSAASFWYDLLAGVTIASLSIPQGISYATLAGIPPVIGLCKIRSRTRNSSEVFVRDRIRLFVD
jgi:sulfate transporter 3